MKDYREILKALLGILKEDYPHLPTETQIYISEIIEEIEDSLN